jgi:hypothetical protein
MSSEQYRWMLIDDFVAIINEYRTRTFVPGGYLEADESMIRWYGIRGSYVDAGIPITLRSSASPTMAARSRISLASHRGLCSD